MVFFPLVENCEPLATFCESLIRKISEFSLELQSDGNFVVPYSWNGGHPFDGNYTHFVSSVKNSLTKWLDSYTKKMRFNETPPDGVDTWIFPSIQMGPFDVRHDCDVTERLLKAGPQGSRYKFATGYFNLTKEYKDIILDKSKGKIFNVIFD